MTTHYQFNTQPKPAPEAVVQSGQARFTVLSARLIRMEYQAQGIFEDRPSQVFLLRRQPVPTFRVAHEAGELVIQTDALQLHYAEGQAFSEASLFIEMLGTPARWRYGMEQKENLLGTTRTLDMADGAVALEPGLLSKRGWTVIDDSRSLVFDENGWLTERQPGGLDLYFMVYGKDYRQGMTEFYSVAGKPGLVPRWALGNWWSRFWGYSAEELGNLMQEFRQHGVPLGVCIIDMDWHLTTTGNGCSGWTGYTWNRKLFPDPPGFIRSLHELGLKTGLNLHPSEGIWPHEEMYPQMASAMGIDPASQQPVRFDIEDPVFAQAYFEHLHHPYEAGGVDFWWMDWQQGNSTRLAGLNLLWWINHLHYLDAGRDPIKRPFLFSRWGGLGNHRYPIGFSGDTMVTWDSLAFQPYMTATAANVGYSWWSHDIGGHQGGMEDGELYTRWVQYGVFSPILRLHSTKNVYQDRRPWGFDANVEQAAGDALRLRHRMIPYLYSMAWKDHREGLPLVRPLYHLEPKCEEAYASPNVYTFGTELLAAPFTSPADPDTRMARQVVWLPGEREKWYGFFDGRTYEGGCWYAIYGKLVDIPVFAREGAIIPLAPEVGWGGIQNPDELEVHIFPGAANRFELYEDDGESQAYAQGEYALTVIETGEMGLDGKESHLPPGRRIHLHAAQGEAGLLPAQRLWTLVCHAVQPVEQVLAWVNGEKVTLSAAYQSATHTLRLGGLRLEPEDDLQVELLGGGVAPVEDDLAVQVKRMAETFRIGTEMRSALVENASELAEDPFHLADFVAGLKHVQLRALLEVLTGAGLDYRQPGGEKAPGSVIAWNNAGLAQIGFLYAIERPILHQSSLRYAAQTRMKQRSLVFQPKNELGGARAVWALDYGALLRVEEHYPKSENTQ